MCGFCSVVVITFASHAKGPRFETGQKHSPKLLIFTAFHDFCGSAFLQTPEWQRWQKIRIYRTSCGWGFIFARALIFSLGDVVTKGDGGFRVNALINSGPPDPRNIILPETPRLFNRFWIWNCLFSRAMGKSSRIYKFSGNL